MERRYWIATLALIAAFVLFSRGLSPEHLTRIPHSRAELMADLRCVRSAAAQRLVATVRPFLKGNVPEAAAIVAELSAPPLPPIPSSPATVQVQIEKRLVDRQCTAAQRSLEMAGHEALRAQRTADRWQDTRIRVQGHQTAMARDFADFDVAIPADFETQIQTTVKSQLALHGIQTQLRDGQWAATVSPANPARPNRIRIVVTSPQVPTPPTDPAVRHF